MIMKINKKGCILIDNKIYFIKTKNMGKSNFIKKFCVKKNSYYYKLYSRLYDYIIGENNNLYREYKRYYKKEFASYDEFLLEHHNIPKAILNNFNNKCSYYKYKDTGNEQPLYCLIQNEKIKKMVNEFMGGFVYEN